MYILDLWELLAPARRKAPRLSGPSRMSYKRSRAANGRPGLLATYMEVGAVGAALACLYLGSAADQDQP